jgi:high affinity sulfate transporter 1
MGIDPARPLGWLTAYDLRWLGADLLAGITLAAYAIPVSLAYSGLAGLPPEVGLYGYLLGGIGYALFGSSRQLAIGPTSAISLMLGASIAALAAGDVARTQAIASLTAVAVAMLCFVAWLFRLSTITSFISETILLGFKAGAGLTIASTQLASFFGVPGGGAGLFSRVWTVATQLPQLHATTTAIALAALVVLVAGERWLPGRPVALAVVVLAIALVGRTSLGDAGVAVVGRIPSGLPHLGWPALRLRDVEGIFPLALGCLLLAYIEGVSAARTLAEAHAQTVDARQELLGLGGANLLVAFGGGYPVAGGLSQSAVNDKAGARTPLALVFASLTLALCLVYLTGLVAHLPKAVLAVIVLVAVRGLIDVRGLTALWRVSRFELAVALVAFAAVLTLGILQGVLIAAIVSILLLLARAADPHVAFLGRIPGTQVFSDVSRHPENERLPGVLVFRVESALLYFNVDNVRRIVLRRIARESAGLRLVVCDLSSSPTIDLAGARLLQRLGADLAARGITFHVAEARASVRDMLRAAGVAETVGSIHHGMTVAEVVNATDGGLTAAAANITR